MIALADIVKQYRNELLECYSSSLLPSHHKALNALVQCRTIAIGTAHWKCDQQQCDKTLRVPLSCGHRSCPRCQNHDVTAWLDRQREKLLPANYFLLTFTLPKQLRPVAWRNQRIVYDCLFKAVSDTLKQFCSNEEHLGGNAGMTLVLHTHTRRLDFHPHIHVVMPGGVIANNGKQWKALNRQYLFNHFALADVFRAKFLHAINKTGLSLPTCAPKKWVAHCKFAGSGEPALKYLARYLYRGVVSESSILSNNNGVITFQYKDSDTGKIEKRSLPGPVFLLKLLRHVLPRSYQRVRHYGFLHHNARVLLQRIQLLLNVAVKPRVEKAKVTFNCACGHGTMKLISIFRWPVVDRFSARASPR